MHPAQLGHVADDRVVEREEPAVAELHDRDGGQRLGDRCVVKNAALRDRLAAGPIGESVLVMRHHPPIVQQGDAGADDAVAVRIRIERLHEGRPLRWCGRRFHRRGLLCREVPGQGAERE